MKLRIIQMDLLDNLRLIRCYTDNWIDQIDQIISGQIFFLIKNPPFSFFFILPIFFFSTSPTLFPFPSVFFFPFLSFFLSFLSSPLLFLGLDSHFEDQTLFVSKSSNIFFLFCFCFVFFAV